jgi:hypothetical protein
VFVSTHSHRECYENCILSSIAQDTLPLDELAMNFLNHFQLPVRYDVCTELLANFEQTKVDHISDHI